MKKAFLMLLYCGTIGAGALGQAGLSTENLSRCKSRCANLTPECNVRIAFYLIHGTDMSDTSCPEIRSNKISRLEGLALAIKFLGRAIANHKGTGVKLSVLHLDKAAVYIEMGQLFTQSGRFSKASTAFQRAVLTYRSMRLQAKRSKDEELLLAISSGLLRAGKAVESLSVLSDVEYKRADKAYLSAEAYFSLGNREAAAGLYEQWVGLGCKSKTTMVLNDEYGSRWALLISSKPEVQNPCEQLPTEVRSRLETLKSQFGRPKNLPARNFDVEFLPEH
jgi:tetratricopeptide (TPR) repeat protein